MLAIGASVSQQGERMVGRCAHRFGEELDELHNGRETAVSTQVQNYSARLHSRKGSASRAGAHPISASAIMGRK